MLLRCLKGRNFKLTNDNLQLYSDVKYKFLPDNSSGNPIDFGELMYENDELYTYLIQNAPTLELQAEIFKARVGHSNKQGVKLLATVMGLSSAPIAVGMVLQSAVVAVPVIYEFGLTSAAQVYFRVQMYAGTISGVGGTGILLGRNMPVVRTRAVQLGLNVLKMPNFIANSGNFRAMGTYNSLWLRYHISQGSSINVLNNAFGSQGSAFMKLEFHILGRSNILYNVIK